MEEESGWGDGLLTRDPSATGEKNERVLLLQLSPTRKHNDSHSHPGLSADLFPLTVSSAEIWTSDKKYKEDVSLSGAVLAPLLFLLLLSLSPSVFFQSQHLMPSMTSSFFG